MTRVESRVRAKVTAYTSALIIVAASSVFLTVVPFLPASPIVPLMVSFGLGALSLRSRGVSIAILYLLVYFSVLWQMIGFGFFQLLSAGVGIAVILAMAVPLVPFMNKRVEMGSMALAILSVALMLTPAYFISVPLLAAAALTFSGFASLEALATTFLFFLTPFILLENALYLTTTSGATAPIIFGQFSLLAQNLRPPLPALNLLLTGLPANYLSHHALPASLWLSESSGILLIPIAILGAVLVASSSLGSVARTLVERFEVRREITGNLRLLLGPLAVGVVIPVVFISLLALLSRPGSGGFQTAFSNDPSHLVALYMVGSSVLITGSFIGRETILLRLESVQVGTESIGELIDACLRKMKRVQELLESVSRRVPSMSLSGEKQSISEYSSYISDVQKQLGGASGSRISQFRAQLETTVLQPLNRQPELLKARVVSEIRGLISATATANNNLGESSVPLRYPDIPEVNDAPPLENLIQAYESAVAALKAVTMELSELYTRESVSLDTLMAQQEVNKPVTPAALLESNEYVGAMRLVSEEYWLNFHLKWVDQLDVKKSKLLARTKVLDGVLTDDERLTLRSIENTVAEAKPANSHATLEKVGELRLLLGVVVARAASGADHVEEMLESLDLKSVKFLRFETTNRLGEIQDLKKKLQAVGLDFDSITRFLESGTGVLESQASAWKSDSENLVLLAQYPLAKKVIGKLLEGQKAVPVGKLPYQRRAATMYAQLYAAGTSSVEYDEQGESLVSKQENA
ncbi:MAG: hypothetical protein OK455_08645 [Thaumarchaeota archaeon]|nr:hypothetical protein [Nitrososphaerota archaeon]